MLDAVLRRQGLESFTFVDVGAMGALDFSPELAGRTSMHAFEPQTAACADLRTRYAAGPFKRLCVIPCALGAAAGVRNFHVTRHPEMSSLLAPDGEAYRKALGKHPRYGKWSQTIDVVRDLVVEVQTLDGYGAVELPIDYLKIDTQGSELQVLQGAQQLLNDRQILVVKVESSTFAMYEGQPLLADIRSFMTDNGFALVDFPVADIGAGLKAPSGDALFVLTDMKEAAHRVRSAVVLSWLGHLRVGRSVAADLLTDQDWADLAPLPRTRRRSLLSRSPAWARDWVRRFL